MLRGRTRKRTTRGFFPNSDTLTLVDAIAE